MRILVLLAAAAALAGCAAPPPPVTAEQIRARAVAASDYQICEALILGMSHGHGYVVEQERRARSLDCAPYANAIVAQDTARRQQALQTFQAIQAMQPVYQPVQQPPLVPIPAPAKPVNCTSQRIGSQVQTSCY